MISIPKYRFDEIAINSTEKKKPTEADKETYIGLEHLDSGILEVTRWGAEVAPVGDKLVMRKGDILFGRRRAYQKKVAIAPFDGIFSAHGMVLRPIETVISKEFFPFFISSDYFLDAAIQISVGSLSPTINWRDLCKLEFEIPTIEEQRELSPILWGMNRLKAAYSNLLQQMDALVQSQFVEMFGDPETNSLDLPLKRLPDIGENLDSRRIPITSGDRKEGKYPYYGASGIVDYVDDYIFDEDILLISEDGANLLARVTPIAFPATGKVWVNNHAHVMRFPSMALQVYIEKLLNMIDISHYVTGTAQPKLNQAKLNAIPIPVPERSLLQRYMVFVQETDKSKLAIQQALDSLEKSRNAIMKKVFG